MEHSHHAGPYPFPDDGVNSVSRSRQWIEVHLFSSIDAGEILAMLDDPLAVGAWVEGNRIRLYWPRQSWNAEALHQLKRVLRALGDHNPHLTIGTVEEQDWNAQWAASVTPFRVGKRLVIRPSWARFERGVDDLEIIVDPKQAFGTGHHATTRLLLERLEEIVRGGERVLDVGTGTGILAMAALRFGAGIAVALDHDPVAVECARSYAEENSFGLELVILHGTLECLDMRPFDVMLANLDRRTLLELFPRFSDLLVHNGILLISGLLTEDLLDIEAACTATRGILTGKWEANGWIALEIRSMTMAPV